MDKNSDVEPSHRHRTYSVSHEMELHRDVDIEDMKRMSSALEAQSELDATRPLAQFGNRFSAANLVATKAQLTLVNSTTPELDLARISIFTRFLNAIYAATRLNNMGLTVSAYSCLREAQEGFDLLRLVNIDNAVGTVVLKGEALTAGEIVDRLVAYENDTPGYASRRTNIMSRAAPSSANVPPIHFEMLENGFEANVDIGGRRIEDAQSALNEIGLGLFEDCIFEFSGKRYGDLVKLHRQMMVNVYSGNVFGIDKPVNTETH